jgi:hypothetical protein
MVCNALIVCCNVVALLTFVTLSLLFYNVNVMCWYIGLNLGLLSPVVCTFNRLVDCKVYT